MLQSAWQKLCLFFFQKPLQRDETYIQNILIFRHKKYKSLKVTLKSLYKPDNGKWQPLQLEQVFNNSASANAWQFTLSGNQAVKDWLLRFLIEPSSTVSDTVKQLSLSFHPT